MSSELHTDGRTRAPRTGLRRYIGPKRVALLTLYGAMAAVIWWYWKQGVLSPESVMRVVAANPVVAPAVFIAAYAVTVVFMVPSLPLNIGAGYLWGPVIGSVYTLIGCTLGSVVAFVFARSALGQPLARRFDNNILQWMVDQLDQHGWQVVAFVRLNPAFPSGPANYLFGLTSISFRTYFWATLIFPYPLCLAFSWVGDRAGAMALDGDAKRLVQLIVAVAATVCLSFLGGYVAKQFAKRSASDK